MERGNMEQKNTREDLRKLQALPLNLKIVMTNRRIREFYKYYDGNVYISFSGGKDSTVLLDLVRKQFPEVEAVFVDTGLEYPEIRAFAKTVSNVTFVRPTKNFRQIIMEYGYPYPSKEISNKIYYAKKGSEWAKKCVNGSALYNGKKSNYIISKKYLNLMEAPFEVSSRCCDIIKKAPIKDYQHRTGKVPYTGTMACESERRTQSWLRYGCNSFSSSPHSAPLSFWTENDILQYIVENNLSMSEAYEEIVNEDGKYRTTKCQRTGCMFCLFGIQFEKGVNRIQKMKETHPKQYAYMMKPVSEGGLGIRDVLEFVGISYE